MAAPADEDQPHWRHLLGVRFPNDREVSLDLRVHGGEDHGDAVAFVSRLLGVFEAMRLKPITDDNGNTIDPLAEEDPAAVLELLQAVHFARMRLQAFEEHVLELAHGHHRITLRTLAQTLEVASPETVRYRLKQIALAGTHRSSAARRRGGGN
jgi:hypothetical protein